MTIQEAWENLEQRWELPRRRPAAPRRRQQRRGTRCLTTSTSRPRTACRAEAGEGRRRNASETQPPSTEAAYRQHGQHVLRSSTHCPYKAHKTERGNEPRGITKRQTAVTSSSSSFSSTRATRPHGAAAQSNKLGGGPAARASATSTPIATTPTAIASGLASDLSATSASFPKP